MIEPGIMDAVDTAVRPDGIDEKTAALVNRWGKKLDHAFEHDKDARNQYAKDRATTGGRSNWQVDANLVGAIIEILCAFIYAKDPDLSVRVADSVGDRRKKELGDVVLTLQVVISRLLRDAGLKRKAQRWVRSACSIGIGWLCVSIQTRSETIVDPVVQKEINDLRDQLQQIAVLEKSLADGESLDEDADRAEIEANMQALQAKLEREIATGIVIDFFSGEDIQVAPDCGELVNYLDAPWIRKRTYKSKMDAQKITGFDDEVMKSANVYTQRPRKGENGESLGSSWQTVGKGEKEAESFGGFYALDEIWSRDDGMVFTRMEGINDRWAREPYAPTTGSRFYDVFMLAFHFVDGERHPQSDAYQLASLQDEYSRTRSNFAEHRKRSIPATYWDAHEVDADELAKINNAELGENVAVRFQTPGTPIGNKFMRTSSTGFDPAMYSTDMIRSDMEKVSGAQDAMQASVQVAKTATEAGIQNEGFGARIGVRRDYVDAALSEMALFVGQLAMQALDEDFIIRIAGPEAVWPQLTVDEIMYAFNIEVRAGSTGKPNKAAQRNAWGTMLPQIEAMVTQIGSFRAQGPQMEWAAQPYIAMLKKSAEVLDFDDDIDEFIPTPPPPPPPPSPEEQMAAMAMQALSGGEPPAPAGPPPPAMSPVMGAIGTPSGGAPD